MEICQHSLWRHEKNGRAYSTLSGTSRALVSSACYRRKLYKRYISETSGPKPLFGSFETKIQEDIQHFVRYGFQMIKHDFTTYDIFGKWGFQVEETFTSAGWHFYDRTKTTAEIIKISIRPFGKPPVQTFISLVAIPSDT